jgi:hypothetical protein
MFALQKKKILCTVLIAAVCVAFTVVTPGGQVFAGDRTKYPDADTVLYADADNDNGYDNDDDYDSDGDDEDDIFEDDDDDDYDEVKSDKPVTIDLRFVSPKKNYSKIFAQVKQKTSIAKTPATGYEKIKSNSGNRSVTLKPFTKIDPTGNPQWVGIYGNYIYIAFTEYASVKNGKGWICKYNLKTKKLVKKGPKFNVGHGQHFGINPKTGKLLFCDQYRNDASAYSEISMKTLKPVGISIGNWNKKVPSNGGSGAGQGGGFTFDKDGNRYLSVDKGLLEGSPQGIGYSKYSNRVVLISNVSTSGYDINAVLGKSSTAKEEIYVTGYKTKKELECITFDAKGYGYVITNRPAQLLKTSGPMFPKAGK